MIDTNISFMLYHIILDGASGDTGGEKEIFRWTVQRLERLGVSGVVIEARLDISRSTQYSHNTTMHYYTTAILNYIMLCYSNIRFDAIIY